MMMGTMSEMAQLSDVNWIPLGPAGDPDRHACAQALQDALAGIANVADAQVHHIDDALVVQVRGGNPAIVAEVCQRHLPIGARLSLLYTGNPRLT